MIKCIICNKPVTKPGYKLFFDDKGHRLCLCFDCCLQLDMFTQLKHEDPKEEIRQKFNIILNTIEDEESLKKAKEILVIYKVL
ncbi:MAG: hypothetical protein DBX47_04450 [Clostridiales bacterium]|nr:MAG: hypothetical protein DBX47_04450 [Clostridiales bacterium]